MLSVGARNGAMKMVKPPPSSTEASMGRAGRLRLDCEPSHDSVSKLIFDDYKLNRHEDILRRFKHLLEIPKGLRAYTKTEACGIKKAERPLLEDYWRS